MRYEEKQLKSECVYDGRIMTVQRDDVELATGQKSFREVVRHSGGVVVLALKDEETILMVKQAGKLEKGENPDDACKRELEEETGYQAEKWTSLGYINTSPGFCDEKLYLYKAEKLKFVGEHPDDGEIISAFEMKLDDVRAKIKNGEINDAKTICAVLRGLYL